MPYIPEWKKHRGTLLAWPQRPELWEGQHEAIQNTWAEISARLSQTEEVHILINEAPLSDIILQRIQQYQPCLIENIHFHTIRTDDVWIRDYSPLWTEDRQALVYEFDGWGEKYTPYAYDNACGIKLLQHFGHKALVKNLVLEGGAIDSDGQTVLASESCLLFRRPFFKTRGLSARISKQSGYPQHIVAQGGVTGR